MLKVNVHSIEKGTVRPMIEDREFSRLMVHRIGASDKATALVMAQQAQLETGLAVDLNKGTKNKTPIWAVAAHKTHEIMLYGLDENGEPFDFDSPMEGQVLVKYNVFINVHDVPMVPNTFTSLPSEEKDFKPDEHGKAQAYAKSLLLRYPSATITEY